MGVVVYPRNKEVIRSNNELFLKHDENHNSKRVIFPEYWCHHSKGHIPGQQHDTHGKQPLDSMDHHSLHRSDPNLAGKRKIFDFGVPGKAVITPTRNRNRIRGTHSLPYIKRNQIEIDSTLSLPDSHSSSRLVKFNPKVSIHLFDIAEVEEALSNKSPSRWWSNYCPF